MQVIKDFIHEGKTYKRGSILSDAVLKTIPIFNQYKMVRFLVLHDPTGKVCLSKHDKIKLRMLNKILAELDFGRGAESPPEPQPVKAKEPEPEPQPEKAKQKAAKPKTKQKKFKN